ncbi:PIN domain-containing protein [Desulfococcaceae bacterium HSG8]|nr:PIN domain-containing protein [Desulfococcaceae bacterium HSG8]
MKTNYILIDYENVQPQNIALLNGHPFHVLVFVGANQTKIPFEVASALQKLGERAKYIKINGNGQNALDFHIAFYIGQIAERDPNSFFHIISNDTGFDPLVSHLKSKKIWAQRNTDLANIPILNSTSGDERLGAILKDLSGRGKSKPRKIATLRNTINSLFLKKLEESELSGLIEQLTKKGYLTVNKEGSVSYKLFK